MAIAVNAATANSGGITGSVTSTNMTNHTVASSLSNSLLVVSLFGTSADLFTNGAVTWNGTPMTAGTLATADYGNEPVHIQYFYLVNPAPGSFTIACSWTTACQMAIGAYTLTGVNQASPIDTDSFGGDTTNVTSIATTFSTNFNDDMVIDFCGVNINTSITKDAAFTQGWNIQVAAGGANSAYKNVPTAGSVTDTVTCGSSARFSMQVVAIRAAGGATTLPTRALLGVGL